MSLNTVILHGRIVNDLDVRWTQNQKQVVSFRLAVDDSYGDNKRTYFISCVAWNKTCEFLSKYFQKGNAVIIKGKLQTREWSDKHDQKRTEIEVNVDSAYFCESKQKGNSDTRGRTTVVPKDIEAGDWEELDDGEELPF